MKRCNFNIRYYQQEYDAFADSWTQKNSLPTSAARCDASTFSICDKGYIGTGQTSIGSLNDLWEYDPLTNQWTQMANFSGLQRNEAGYFSIGMKGYIGLGEDNNGLRFTDFWEYTPDSVTCIAGIADAIFQSPNFTISPIPANNKLNISFSTLMQRDYTFTFTNAMGAVVKEYILQNIQGEFKQEEDLSPFTDGVYFLIIHNNDVIETRRFIKVGERN